MYHRISIKPQFHGVLYINNVFAKILKPGLYRIFKPFTEVSAYSVPTGTLQGNIINQEINTKDNISLRLSFYYTYKICNEQKYIENLTSSSLLEQQMYSYTVSSDERISKLIQELARNIISNIQSDELNAHRESFINDISIDELNSKISEYGLEVSHIALIDISFPKNIREIFALELEAKVRARADLESARAAVASARTYKNAAALIDGDKDIKFIQMLDVLQKIAQKGNHTFVIGEQLNKNM